METLPLAAKADIANQCSRLFAIEHRQTIVYPGLPRAAPLLGALRGQRFAAGRQIGEQFLPKRRRHSVEVGSGQNHLHGCSPNRDPVDDVFDSEDIPGVVLDCRIGAQRVADALQQVGFGGQ